MKASRKKITTSWKSYFDFSARERRGISVLGYVLIFQICVLIYLRNSPVVFDPPNVKLFESMLSEKHNENVFVQIKQDTLFQFEPNRLSASKWVMLGFSEKQSSSILHYVEKGGKFRVKDDLKKIYGLSDAKFHQLKPFILLPDSLPRAEFKKSEADKARGFSVEINSADSIQWDKLYGIGPVLASRIVRYRERLGGFASADQIREVWGVQDTVFEKISKYLTLKAPPILRKIHLNSDSLSVISSHPYLNRKIARMIVNYRDQHPFQSIDELSSLPLLTEENFRKLAPYLTTE